MVVLCIHISVNVSSMYTLANSFVHACAQLLRESAAATDSIKSRHFRLKRHASSHSNTEMSPTKGLKLGVLVAVGVLLANNLCEGLKLGALFWSITDLHHTVTATNLRNTVFSPLIMIS